MPKGKPVVFGEKTSPRKTDMKLAQSRYATRQTRAKRLAPTPSNNWKEIPIHESNLIVALEYAMRQTTQLKASESIERVIVGEPANGVYPLSVAIIKRKEV